MNALLGFIIQQIVLQAPALAIDLVQILNKPTTTEADWAALKAKYAGKTYEQYLRDAGLIVSPAPPAA